jgi:hypothetical protein
MDEWCFLDRTDVPYWYGERTLTGFLNAAAWKTRGLALEESAAARGPVRKPRAGRIDSYIVLGQTKIWYQLEAKVAWPSKPGAKGLRMAATYVTRALDDAEEQLESPAKDYYGHWGLALCFIVPELSWSKNYDDPPDSNFLDELMRRLGHRALLASYRPPTGQKPWMTKPKRRNYRGVLLVGRVSWRPRA